MLVAFAEKARDVIKENADFEKRELAAKIDERSLLRMPDGGGKVQNELLWASSDNSTVMRVLGTGDFISEKNGEKRWKRQAQGTNREEIENAVLPAGLREDLRIHKTRVQAGIVADDILTDESFELTLGLRAIESVARFRGKRVTTIFKLLKQILQC